jgi:hypothetical protein
MSVQVYGCNHVVIEVTDAKKAVQFYSDVFGLNMLSWWDREGLDRVRRKLTSKYKLKLHPDFRCDFRDPWGNRIQVGDLSDESLVWLLPYQEVQKVGLTFTRASNRRRRN